MKVRVISADSMPPVCWIQSKTGGIRPVTKKTTISTRNAAMKAMNNVFPMLRKNFGKVIEANIMVTVTPVVARKAWLITAAS